MSGQPFIKFYPSDWLGGTRGLSAAETGVYITLVCLMYENEGRIAYDEARLARQCGCPKAAFAKAVESLVDLGKIQRDGDALTNRRVLKELGDLANRRENGRVAATQRWSAPSDKNEQKQCDADAGAMLPQCVADAIPEARVQKEESGKPLSDARGEKAQVERGFEAFYAAFPRKQDRKKAHAAFLRVVTKGEASVSQLVEGAKRFAIETAGRDPTKIPHPTTWLNGARWEDQPLPLTPMNGGPHGTPARTGRQAAYDDAAEERRRFARSLD